jgi:hypothetical protein
MSGCQKPWNKKGVVQGDNSGLITELSTEYVLDNHRSIPKYSLNNINFILLSSIFLIQKTENFIICSKRCLTNAEFVVAVSNPTVMLNTVNVLEEEKLVERIAVVWIATTASLILVLQFESVYNLLVVSVSRVGVSRNIVSVIKKKGNVTLNVVALNVEIYSRSQRSDVSLSPRTS